MIPKAPSVAEVGNLLRNLLARNVAVRAVSATRPRDPVLAVYRADGGEPAAVLTCDTAASSAAGAALCMIPAAEAQRCARSGRLSPVIEEAFHEVANIMAQLLNQTGGPHVVLASLHAPPEGLAADVAAALSNPGWRIDLEVDVSGYSRGYLSFVALA